MNQLKADRTKEDISKFYRLRAEFNAIAEYRTKGAIIRSRICWHENGEKRTLNTFWIRKKRQHCKSYISKLKTNDDIREINDPKTISYILQRTAMTRIMYSNVSKLEATQQEELRSPLLNEECFINPGEGACTHMGYTGMFSPLVQPQRVWFFSHFGHK